tara:strand:+ start:1663 stop:2268 length:606 start_codon:yes stop_codon:yes gene_type:complete
MYKHVVVISAHPDDLEMGCSGTLMKMMSDGTKVTSIVMVGDVPHSDYLDKAASIMKLSPIGFNPIIFSNTSDRFSVDHKTIAKLEQAVDFSEVDLIITHWKEDAHQDHRACYDIANSLRRHQPMDVWYMSSYPYNLKYSSFNPNTYVDITDHYIQKMAVMKAYQNISANWHRGVQAHDSWRGTFIDSVYAEAFMSDTRIVL